MNTNLIHEGSRRVIKDMYMDGDDRQEKILDHLISPEGFEVCYTRLHLPPH